MARVSYLCAISWISYVTTAMVTQMTESLAPHNLDQSDPLLLQVTSMHR